MNRRRSVFARMAAAALAFFAFLPIRAQEAVTAKPLVVVFGFINLTGDGSLDLPAERVTADMTRALRMLGRFDVEESPTFLRTLARENLDSYCSGNGVDYVLYGVIRQAGAGGQRCELALFDKAKGDVAFRGDARSARPDTLPAVTDGLTLSALSALSGRTLGFGSLAFSNTGDPIDYEVSVDGISLGLNATGADRILTGDREITVYRGSGLARQEVKTERLTVIEGKTSTVTFALEKGKSPDAAVVVQTIFVEKGAEKPVMATVTGGSPKKNWPYGPVADFMISITEITQTQYQAATGKSVGSFSGYDLPAESVSWYEAIEFCNALSAAEGLEPAYAFESERVVWNTKANGYRLPTHAEWDFAARGGILGKGFAFAGGDDLGAVAWTARNSSGLAHSVGLKAPNELGLFDMSGNVSEWVWSGSAADKKGVRPEFAFGKKSSGYDPWARPYDINLACAKAGGSWQNDSPENFRCGKYDANRVPWGNNSTGFRVCRNAAASR